MLNAADESQVKAATVKQKNAQDLEIRFELSSRPKIHLANGRMVRSLPRRVRHKQQSPKFQCWN
jgi:hypothetical protein